MGAAGALWTSEELEGSAWVAGSTSFLLFAAAAVIGVGITIITGQAALHSGIRQLAFNLVAHAITWGSDRCSAWRCHSRRGDVRDRMQKRCGASLG